MPAPAPSQFTEVLAGALALPAEDRMRLCSVLQRLAQAAPAAAPVLSPADVHTPGPGLPGEETLEDWLRQIAREPAWTQLLLLDEALENVDADGEATALKAARSRLLQADPAIAVRHAVVALASQHPIAVSVGAFGLALALFGLARVLLRTVF